jgi:hypothetical protein
MLDKDFCSVHAHCTKNLLLLVFAGLLGGCVTQPLQLPNGFARFYQDDTQNMRPEMRQRLLPPSGPPQIENVALAQLKDETARFIERGLIRIGVASYTGPVATRENA